MSLASSSLRILYQDQLPPELACPICEQALRAPVRTSCGHDYCSECCQVEMVCILCNATVESMNRNNEKQRMVGSCLIQVDNRSGSTAARLLPVPWGQLRMGWSTQTATGSFDRLQEEILPMSNLWQECGRARFGDTCQRVPGNNTSSSHIHFLFFDKASVWGVNPLISVTKHNFYVPEKVDLLPHQTSCCRSTKHRMSDGTTSRSWSCGRCGDTWHCSARLHVFDDFYTWRLNKIRVLHKS